MEIISEYLSLVIVTYNRAKLLDRTLNCILSSPFKNCPLTVLDNCSTDDTRFVANQYKENHQNLQVITNKYNIGGDANIMRAIEYASTKYLWILADDDTYDFSYCNELIEKLCHEDIDLLHIGGHKELEVNNSDYSNPKDAVAKGYPYFKTCSFLPANIFKVELMRDSLIAGYRNINNSYAHMPCFIKLYESNGSFYVARNKIVHAEIGAQNYTFNDLLEWWINTGYSCINDNGTRLQFVYSQFFSHKQNFKYIRLLRLLHCNHVDIICILQVLLMKNVFFSCLCFTIALLWEKASRIKNILTRK